MARCRKRSSIKLDEYVRQLITLAGGKARVDGDVLHVDLPIAVAETLGLKRRHRLRFGLSSEQEVSKEPEDFVAIGHPIIDRLLAYAATFGGATKLVLPFAMDAEFLHQVAKAKPGMLSTTKAIDDMIQKMSRIRFANATSAVWQKQLVYRTEILFRFRVSVSAGDRKEYLVTVMIDPTTEEMTRPVDLSRAMSLPECRDDDPDLSYRLSRLYRQCEKHVGPKMNRLAAPFLAEAESKRQLEHRRIDEYYQGLMAEQLDPLKKVFRQMAVAKVRAELARTATTENKARHDLDELKNHARQLEAIYDEKLVELSKERDHRWQEVSDRYQPIAKVSLRQVALVLLPKVEWRLSLTGPAQRDMIVSYDPIRRQVDGWRCECCGLAILDEGLLCACATVVCGDCSSVCVGCGRSVCLDCTDARCHLCDEPVCTHCPSTCLMSSAFNDLHDVSVCVRCQKQSCPTCVGVGYFHLKGVGAS